LDSNNTFHLKTTIDIKSDHPPLDTFEEKWTTLPNHKEQNSIYGDISLQSYYNFKEYKIGALKEYSIDISMNSGFIQTWYYANRDFNTLLHKSNIGQSVSSTNIEGYLNYYEVEGFYLQKIWHPKQNHFFSTKLKLLQGKEYQSLDIKGTNTNSRFRTSFDYYYSDKNYISKNNDHTTNYSAKGYGVDLEYIYKSENFYGYLGLYNIFGSLYWDGVSLMHYDLDSKTIYKGDDGYNHQKAFGVGYYKYDINYKQKLNRHTKVELSYNLSENFILNNSTNIYTNSIYNNTAILYKRDNSFYKIGYIQELNKFNLGIYLKYLSVELYNSFDLQKNLLFLNFHCNF